jgi:hypothetical protein
MAYAVGFVVVKDLRDVGMRRADAGQVRRGGYAGMGLDVDDGFKGAVARAAARAEGNGKKARLERGEPIARFPQLQRRVFRFGRRLRWYAMRFEGDDSEIDIGPKGPMKSEFDAWRWVPLTEVPSLAVDFRRSVYEEVVQEFSCFARRRASPIGAFDTPTAK